MAGTSVERPLPEIIENNLRALVEVYEGALRQGVRRVVFASSNHAIGMYPADREARPGLRAAPRRLLRPEQGLGRGAGAAVLGQARHRERVRAHRQLRRAADRAAPPEHLVRPRRPAALRRPLHRGARRRLPGGLGRVGQHAQLVGQQRRRAARLPADAGRRGLRRPRSSPARTRSTRSVSRFQGGSFASPHYTRGDIAPDAAR